MTDKRYYGVGWQIGTNLKVYIEGDTKEEIMLKANGQAYAVKDVIIYERL